MFTILSALGSPPRNASGRSVCPGVTIQHRVHGSVTVQWAHTEEEYATIVAAVEQVAGGAAELVCNHRFRGCGRGWAARWQFVRSTLQQLGVRSLLDVGGIGSGGPYFKHFEYACANVEGYRGCQRYHGDKLRHTNGSFDGVLVESTLHHAAEQTLPLLQHIRRVTRRWVLRRRRPARPRLGRRRLRGVPRARPQGHLSLARRVGCALPARRPQAAAHLLPASRADARSQQSRSRSRRLPLLGATHELLSAVNRVIRNTQ